MEHGQHHGSVQAWHPNGRPKLQGSQRQGRRQGVWVHHGPDGRLTGTCRYEQGKVVEGDCSPVSPEPAG
jgi:antitoxin component YwqK of YwqJK toxin-antitoxin module